MSWPTTITNIWLAAQQDDADAIARLYGIYYMPVLAFLKKGWHEEDARDLAQEFFTKFLAKKWIKNFDCEKGRFRTFLCTCLTRFVRDELDRRQTKFERSFGSLGDFLEPQNDETPEMAFHRTWAEMLLEAVKTRFSQETSEEDRSVEYEIFALYYYPETMERPTCAQIADKLGITAKTMEYRMSKIKMRYKRILWEEIRKYGDLDVAEEIVSLARILTR